MKFLLAFGFTCSLFSLGAQTKMQNYETLKQFSLGDQANAVQVPSSTLTPGERVNEIYLDNNWRKATLAFYTTEKIAEGWMVRYELRTNTIEVRLENDVRVLDVRFIKSLSWPDSITNVRHNFVNGKDYKIDGTPLTSLIEVLTEGTFSLYKQHTFWIKKPDYNPALSVGNKDEKAFKKSLFFYSADRDLHRAPSKKKDLPVVFANRAPEVTAFIKEKKLDLDSEADLAAIFSYYNSLK